MNFFVGTLLAIAGIAVLFWNKSLSRRLALFYAHRFSSTFGRLAHSLGWDDPDKPFNRFLYRFVVIFIGCFLLLMAFHSFVGTIYTGSAAQPTDQANFISSS